METGKETVNMPERLKADIGGIGSVRAQMADCFAKIRKEQDLLADQYHVLDGMWEGEAHEVFLADCTDALKRLEAVYEKAIAVLSFEEKAVIEYGKADADTSGQVAVL